MKEEQKKQNSRRIKQEDIGIDTYSRAYHRFFQNCAEYYVTKENGRRKLVREYTGSYYVSDIPGKKKKGYDISCLLFLILSAVLFLKSGIQPYKMNTTAYVTIFQACMLLDYFICFTGCINGLLAGEKLKIREYESGIQRLKNASLSGIFVCGLTVTAGIICILCNGKNNWKGQTLCVAGFLLSDFLMAGVYLISKRNSYHEETNTVKVPDDAAMIR